MTDAFDLYRGQIIQEKLIQILNNLSIDPLGQLARSDKKDAILVGRSCLENIVLTFDGDKRQGIPDIWMRNEDGELAILSASTLAFDDLVRFATKYFPTVDIEETMNSKLISPTSFLVAIMADWLLEHKPENVIITPGKRIDLKLRPQNDTISGEIRSEKK